MTAVHTIHHKLKTTEVLQYKQHKIRDLINFLKFSKSSLPYLYSNNSVISSDKLTEAVATRSSAAP